MSSAPDTHGHDAPDTHAFTGEPAHALPPDEPPTPGWLPLVGVALFTGAAIVLLAGHGNAESGGSAPPAAAVQAVAPVAATATAVPAMPARPGPPRPLPGQGAEPPRPISPDQIEQMRKNKGLLPKRPAPAR